MIIICILIVVVVIFALIFITCSKKKLYSGGYIADAFTDFNKNAKDDPSGWQLYLSTTCKHCIKQKEVLNGFNTYAEYDYGQLVTNNINGKLYPIKDIKGFPFWYNTKTKSIKLGKIDNLCELSPKPLIC
jgi:hypothetical protein